MIFKDLGKTYDRVPRKVLWNVVKLILDLYDEVRKSVKNVCCIVKVSDKNCRQMSKETSLAGGRCYTQNKYNINCNKIQINNGSGNNNNTNK